MIHTITRQALRYEYNYLLTSKYRCYLSCGAQHIDRLEVFNTFTLFFHETLSSASTKHKNNTQRHQYRI